MSDHADASVYLRVQPQDVNFVNRIFDGCEYLGVVTTLEPIGGLLVIRATPDTRLEALDILAHLPVPWQFVEKV